MFTIKEFAFETPLYTKKDLPKDLQLKGILAGFFSGKIDGYCPNAEKKRLLVSGDSISITVIKIYFMTKY